MVDFYISRKDWNKTINYAKASVKLHSNAEIGGMMVMLKNEDGDYILKDPVILKQTVTQSTCTMDQNELALFYSKTYRKHKKKGRVRYVWWHSHANMNAFWSSTDNKTIMSSPSDDFTVSLVVNVKGEYKLRVQFFEPIELEEDVELYIMDGKESTIPKAIMSEVEEKCVKQTYTHAMDRKKLGKVKDMTQVNMWDTVYNSGYGDYGYGYSKRKYSTQPNDVDYNTLVKYIDSLNHKYVAGEIKYNQWKKALIWTNKQLEEKQADFRVSVLDSTALDEVIYYSHADDYITTINGFTGEKQ